MLPSALTIRSLAILFDEGTDSAPIPAVPFCPLGTGSPGFVFLDNITVTANGDTHVWTSASDNGNGGDPIIADPTGTDVVEDLLGDSVLSLFP